MNPLNSDRIDWVFSTPWGGGDEGSRSIRIYYGSHALRAIGNKYLTAPDIAWVYVDDQIPPEKYDWHFIVGHEPWLWPCGFNTSPYSRSLREELKKSNVHRILQVQGYDAHTLSVIEEGEVEVVGAGPAISHYRHPYLGLGEGA